MPNGWVPRRCDAARRLIEEEDPDAPWRCGECDFEVGGYFCCDEKDRRLVKARAAAGAAASTSPLVAEARVGCALDVLGKHGFAKYFSHRPRGNCSIRLIFAALARGSRPRSNARRWHAEVAERRRRESRRLYGPSWHAGVVVFTDGPAPAPPRIVSFARTDHH